MGQVTALIYKNYLVIVRRKAICLFQFLVPLMSLVVIVIVKSVYQSVYIPENSHQALPTYIYESGIPSKLVLLRDKTSTIEIENCHQIFEYSFENDIPKKSVVDFKSLLESSPSSYTSKCEGKTNPEWVKASFNNSELQNQRLINDIYYLNTKKRDSLGKDLTMPDASILVNKLTKNGISINMMINNLVYWEYHRPNGLTAFKHKFTKESIPDKIYTSTEGYLAIMGFFSNTFLKDKTENDSHIIRGMTSATVDSNLESSFVESIQGFIETIVFPLSQCLGLPVMLYVLVMEKEEGLKSLLEIMGLKPSNYWKAHILFYTGMFMMSNALFYLVGRIVVGGKFFNNASILLLTITFLGWDLSQIGMALFMSIFITNKTSALYLGYILNFLLVITIGNLSLFFFSAPSTLPKIFYLVPHSCIIRGLYYQVKACVENNCIHHVWDINLELWVDLILPFIHFVVYFVVGLAFAETRITSKIKQAMAFRSRKLANPDQSYEFRMAEEIEMSQSVTIPENTRSINNLDATQRAVPDEQPGNPGERLRSRINQGKEPSVILHEAEVRRLEVGQSEYVFYCKDLMQSYVSQYNQNVEGADVKHVLNGVTFGIKKNEIFGLIGPNGAGKSTLINVITSQLEQDSGEFVLGEVEDHIIDHKRLLIGYCPQNDLLWEDLTVREHLIIFCMLKSIVGQSIQEEINLFTQKLQIASILDKHVKNLSGGQQRKVSLAIAFIGRPKLVILDEPSKSLDPVKRRKFWDLTKTLLSDNSVFLTSHLMEEVETLCNRVAIIFDGVLRCVDKPSVLKTLADPCHYIRVDLKPFYFFNKKELNSKKILLVKQIQGLLSDLKFKSGSGTSFTFQLKETSRVPKSLLFSQMASLEDSCISSWSMFQCSLDDVFFQIIRKYTTAASSSSIDSPNSQVSN